MIRSIARAVFTFGFKRRDRSFVEVVAAHKEKVKIALESLWQNPGRLDIGLYLPIIELRGAGHQTELRHGGLFMLVSAAS